MEERNQGRENKLAKGHEGRKQEGRERRRIKR